MRSHLGQSSGPKNPKSILITTHTVDVTRQDRLTGLVVGFKSRPDAPLTQLIVYNINRHKYHWFKFKKAICTMIMEHDIWFRHRDCGWFQTQK